MWTPNRGNIPHLKLSAFLKKENIFVIHMTSGVTRPKFYVFEIFWQSLTMVNILLLEVEFVVIILNNIMYSNAVTFDNKLFLFRLVTMELDA